MTLKKNYHYLQFLTVIIVILCVVLYGINSLINKKESLKKLEEEKNKEFDEPADQWLNCEAKRIWFKDHEVIAEWIAWEQAILEAEDELKFDNLLRWENYWLPRLVKFQSLIAMVLEVDKKHALELAKQIKLPPLS